MDMTGTAETGVWAAQMAWMGQADWVADATEKQAMDQQSLNGTMIPEWASWSYWTVISEECSGDASCRGDAGSRAWERPMVTAWTHVMGGVTGLACGLPRKGISLTESLHPSLTSVHEQWLPAMTW